MVERDKVGGTCLHRGCVPAKEFLETAAVYRTVGGAAEFGIDAGAGAPTVDFAVSQARKHAVVDQLFRGLSGLLKGRQVTVLSGTGTLLPGRRVRVVDGDDAGTELVGRHVVLAAGLGAPHAARAARSTAGWCSPPTSSWTSTSCPATVAVVGGGAIGCEFASLLSDLGSRVTVLEALDAILPGCDAEVAAVVARSFRSGASRS